MSETFSVPLHILIKLCYAKALEWSRMVPGPEAKSSSEITNLTLFTISYHSQITADGDCSHEMKRLLLFGRKAMPNRDSVLKGKDITLPVNLYSQSYGFSSSHVGKWELDNREDWAPKN
jgi:Tfp pilus assembly protein PilV